MIRNLFAAAVKVPETSCVDCFDKSIKSTSDIETQWQGHELCTVAADAHPIEMLPIHEVYL